MHLPSLCESISSSSSSSSSSIHRPNTSLLGLRRVASFYGQIGGPGNELQFEQIGFQDLVIGLMPD